MSGPAFPLDARSLLPHAGPMCCIDRLLSAGATAAVAELVLTPEHCLLDAGVLDPAGYVELAAQAVGAMDGALQAQSAAPPRMGFLVGVQQFAVSGEAVVGDRLRIEVAIEAELGEFSVCSARIFRHGSDNPQLLAEGRLKVFIPA